MFPNAISGWRIFPPATSVVLHSTISNPELNAVLLTVHLFDYICTPFAYTGQCADNMVPVRGTDTAGYLPNIHMYCSFL